MGGLFVAPIFNQDAKLCAIVGAFAGFIIGAYFFREPRHEAKKSKHSTGPGRFADGGFTELVMRKLERVYHAENPESSYQENTNNWIEDTEDRENEEGKDEICEFDHEDNEEDETGQNLLRIFIYPTQRPITMAILWLLAYMALIKLFPVFAELIQKKESIDSILLLPVFLLFGISGLMIIRREKTVDKVGYVIKGDWAIVDGLLRILTGWGIGAVLVISLIF